MDLRFALARTADLPLLARLNRELIEDESHRNPSSLAQLEERLATWLLTDHQAYLLYDGTELVGYVLWRDTPDLFLIRHFFICRGLRRRGYGRAAMRALLQEKWPQDRRKIVEALVLNAPAVAFWRSLGFADYSIAFEMRPGKSG